MSFYQVPFKFHLFFFILLGGKWLLSSADLQEELQRQRRLQESDSSFDIAKTYFLKDEDRFNVASQSALNLHNALPVGSYTIGMYPTGMYYLKQIQPFDISGKTKLYGQVVQHGQRILDTFIKARNGQATGVLLAGQKGSGKTLLAKYVSVQAAKLGISTIVINEAWSGERFNAFIQSIQQPAIVLFDEFEKVYRQPMEAELKENSQEQRYYRHHHGGHGSIVSVNGERLGVDQEGPNPSQDAILTLLDGVYPSNMLFLLTVNDKTKITKNMKNRPGRIYYVLDFAGLESDFVRDYCEDNLQNKTYITEVVSMASLFDAFSFDMLQALVQEMNHYMESPKEVLKWMNIKLGKGEGRQDSYHVKELIVNGADKSKLLRNRMWTGSPATSDYISIDWKKPGFFGGGLQTQGVYFVPSQHLVSGNITSGIFVFEQKEEKTRMVLIRYGVSDPLDMASRLSM